MWQQAEAPANLQPPSADLPLPPPLPPLLAAAAASLPPLLRSAPRGGKQHKFALLQLFAVHLLLPAAASQLPLVCRVCLNPGGPLVAPCCCPGGIHPACLQEEKASSRHPGFCDACGELFSEHPPVLVGPDAAAAAGASSNRPSRPQRALKTVVAAAGLLAVGGAVAYFARSCSRHSGHSGPSSKHSRARPASKRSAPAAAAAKQAAQGKATEQGGGRAASWWETAHSKATEQGGGRAAGKCGPAHSKATEQGGERAASWWGPAQGKATEQGGGRAASKCGPAHSGPAAICTGGGLLLMLVAMLLA